MKVSTDAVLLGAWVPASGAGTILDIGTGSGVIALMLAQKSQAKITAIDIDRDSSEQAQDNVSSSPFSSRVEVIHSSLQDFSRSITARFNLIVTNPPYFIDSLKSNTGSRTIARHTDTLPFSDLIACVKKLLHEKGKFCLILPRMEAETFRKMAESEGLYLSKLLRVRTTADKSSEKRHLMQFEFKESEFSESSLVIEADKQRNYTREYKELTRDFYLHF